MTLEYLPITQRIDVAKEFEIFCKSKGIEFQGTIESVSPYDNTTLFCPSGMQQFKSDFTNPLIQNKTIGNIQPCIRMNDFEEVGDKSHLLYFNMIGLFSFRDKSIEWAIDFWIEFLDLLGVKLEYVTLHQDMIGQKEWVASFDKWGETIVIDSENCTWTDGNIGGYCTEFFVKYQGEIIEIGNIVNPLGDCIDVGFGLERLEMVVNGLSARSKGEVLKESILKIINSGYKPSNLKQGYVLRKLLRELYKLGESIEHPYFSEEIERQKKISEKYQKLKDKFKHKSKEWWFDTHGINIEEFEDNK